MKLRNAKVEELELIRKLRVEAYSEHASQIPEKHWRGLRKAISSDADNQPGVELIVAEIDGEIAGSIVLFPAKTDAYEGYVDELDYPEIRMLAVTPEFRGKGVAKALISECIQRTKAKNFDTIGLHTGDFMKSAINLYEHIGFERIPQHDFEPGNDGIIVKAFRLSI